MRVYTEAKLILQRREITPSVKELIERWVNQGHLRTQSAAEVHITCVDEQQARNMLEKVKKLQESDAASEETVLPEVTRLKTFRQGFTTIPRKIVKRYGPDDGIPFAPWVYVEDLTNLGIRVEGT
jgi:hypothetical protein